MSDISKGDLCVVVKPRPCCGNASAIGKVARVIGEPHLMDLLCMSCKSTANVLAVHVEDEDPFLYREVARLRRIPPLGELDAVKRDAGVLA